MRMYKVRLPGEHTSRCTRNIFKAYFIAIRGGWPFRSIRVKRTRGRVLNPALGIAHFPKGTLK